MSRFSRLFRFRRTPDTRDRLETGSEPPSPRGPSLGFLAGVAVAVVGLFVVNFFLARSERAGVRASATRLFESGKRLAGQEDYQEAIKQYHAALSLSPEQSEYQLALVLALIKLGKLAEAETDLTELLRRDPIQGPANLTMARLLVQRGRVPEAEAYYHRAIYGLWPNDADGNRTQVRLELIELLVRNDAKKELLAELLPLQDYALEDPEKRRQLAAWFLKAGSPPRAAQIYREVIRKQGRDAEAYAGLGEAELAQGNYFSAQAAFGNALRLSPEDTGIQSRLEICDQVLRLDPMRRRLSSTERYLRSQRLVELALNAMQHCYSEREQTPSKPAEDASTQARKMLKRRIRRPENEDVEANLSLAEQLWQLRKDLCGERPATVEEPLALALARLSQ